MYEVIPFCDLFDKVFNTVNNGQVTDEDIAYNIGEVRARFENGPIGACDVQEGESLAYRLAFFLRLSPLSAAVTRSKTLSALRNCEEFRSCLRRPTLNIVNVGGGAGSDLVGLYSAIYGYSGFQEMNVLLIDHNPGWEQFFRQVDTSLRQDSFGYASLLMEEKKVSISFECADMRNALPDNVQANLGDADIVFIKGVLSVMHKRKSKPILENIIKAVTEKAMIVVMDSHYRCQQSFTDYISQNKLEVVKSQLYVYNFILNTDFYKGNKSYLAPSTNFEFHIFKKKPNTVKPL